MARLRFQLTLTVFLLTLLAGCKGDLPKPTQNGANIFGCKINGQPWIPNGGGLFSGLKPISAYYLTLPTHDHKLGIEISAHSSDRQSVRIQLNDIRVGSYQLRQVVPIVGKDSARSYASYTDRRGATSRDEIYYATSDQHGGQVIITRSDSIAKVISGRFSFIAVDDPGRTATISDGRFDVKYPL